MRTTGDSSPASPAPQTPLALLQAGLAALVDTDLPEQSDEQVHTQLPALLAAYNQLAAVIATVVTSFDTRDLAPVDGCRSTRAWLVAFGRMSHAAAGGWLTRARTLRELPALAGAAREGAASTEHVGKVADLIRRLDAGTVRDFDQILADLSATAGPAQVQKACERIAAHLDPDGAPPDPERDLHRREFTLTRVGSMINLRGRFDLEGGAALATAIDAILRPPAPGDDRTPTQRRADAMVELARTALSAGTLPTVGGVRPSLGILITPDALLAARTAAHPDPARLFTPDADHIDTDTDTDTDADTDDDDDDDERNCDDRRNRGRQAVPHGRPGADGHGNEDALSRAGVPHPPEPPWLAWAGEIPAELAHRLACDCDTWRAVLDPATGLPLELGRAHRIVPHWIRKALHARDRSCRFPGCSTPVSWTDAHHLVAWYHGGPTDIDNLICLCRYHHMLVHEGQWTLHLDTTTGAVHAYRPNGQPYELGPSWPHTGPTRQRAA